MDKQQTRHLHRASATAAGLALAALGIFALPSTADHGFPHLEQLARGTFLDDVALTVRNKVAGRATHVVNIRDGSDLVVLRITIEAGGIAPWHGHTGTGFLVNMGPGTLTNFVGDDCVPREFYPGEAFVDPGHGVLHAVRNDSPEDIVLVATFFGVEDAPVAPEPAPEGCLAL